MNRRVHTRIHIHDQIGSVNNLVRGLTFSITFLACEEEEEVVVVDDS